MTVKTIHWFRNDLRLADNPGLLHAAKQGAVLPIYIVDTENAGAYAPGAASNWWLHHALTALNQSLEGHLAVYRGSPATILTALIEQFNITSVTWNRIYEPWQIARDTALKKQLIVQGIAVHSFNASLLWEPWTILKKDGTPYKVFTPYYRKGCLQSTAPRPPYPCPQNPVWLRDKAAQCIDDVGLLPTTRWDKKLERHWQISEQSAHDYLQYFLSDGLANYRLGRDFPDQQATSRLSAFIHWGQLSPRQIWHAIKAFADDDNTDTFCSELAWREFAYYLLYHNPDLPEKNLQSKFDHFPWLSNPTRLAAWQRGQTGIPLVDAGMRELWQTGTMHNRVRMVVASFLVKNLRLHWHFGQRWFWDCLIDADLASNSASWQWVAGCGSDAAPYFRIFNPVTQGQKFDPDGNYIRQYVPEIAALPNKVLHAPWTAKAETLATAGIVLGETYPEPTVDIKASRLSALEAFKSL